MYNKKVFHAKEISELHAFIKAYNFGIIVSSTSGAPVASYLPFVLDTSRGEFGTLIAHIARANHHADLLTADREVLVMFSGTHGYISTSWYEARDTAPTWNYITVQCQGKPVLATSTDHTRHSVEALTEYMEQGRPNPWSGDELGQAGMERRLKQIIGFEIPITHIEGKFKLGQDERPGDTRLAIEQLEREGQPVLAEAMQQRLQQVTNLPK